MMSMGVKIDEYTISYRTISPAGVVIDSPNVQGDMRGMEKGMREKMQN
jgi:hypothetical protein